MSKLTLYIDKATLKKARAVALQNGKSISAMVRDYFNSLSKSKGKAYPVGVSSLLGMVKDKRNPAYKQIRDEYYEYRGKRK